ncbi:hypothetical protein F4775DRAFT_574140 [Biscogniauxia sp. FL1348]|nr:hypothetical protein F4775DRAFT_574140 [Biscogniauxia sp. FL1348]
MHNWAVFFFPEFRYTCTRKHNIYLPRLPKMCTSNSIYHIGQILNLTILNDQNDLTHSQLEVAVREIRQPFTLSCGLVVEIVKNTESYLDQGSIVFLKLYDRRLSDALRKDHDAAAWTSTIESDFTNFVKNENAAAWLKGIIHEESDRDGETDYERGWSRAQTESYLTYQCAMLHNMEVVVYKRLKEHQGEKIPKLLAPVSLNSQDPTGGFHKREGLFPNNATSHDMWNTMFEIRGIMVEFIDGFDLSTLGEGKFAPRDKWQQIVSDAADVVHIMDDKNILNKDVRPENFLVIPRRVNSSHYQPKMIDFGLCRLRQDSESEADWGYAKWIQDEEGAVWHNMRNKLRRVGFELDIVHSEKYIEYAKGEI